MSVSYIVEQSSASSGPWAAVAGSPFTSLTDTITGLTAGTNYFFRFTAQDSLFSLTGPPTVFGPVTTTSINLTESAQNTRLTSTSGNIVDANKQAWSLVGTAGSLQVLHPDGTHDGSNVTVLVYWNHIVFRDDSTGWFYWNGVGWAAATGDPATSESIQGMQVKDTVGQINDSSGGQWRLLNSTVSGVGTYATPGSGSITDPSGNVWAIASNGDVTENGTAVVGGSGTSAIDLFNGQIWAQDVTTGTWYLWNGSTWVQQSSAPTNLPGTSTGLQIVHNGAADTSTSNVILLLYYNHLVYQENSSNLWWFWNGAWVSTTDPRTTTLTESSSGTSLNSTTGSIIDSNLLQWNLVLSAGSGLEVAKGGAVDGTTAQVLLLLYWNHLVYQESSNTNELNITPGWWYWDGTAWKAVTGDPRASVATWSSSDKSSTVTLSNNNLTATTATAGAPVGVQAGRIADLLETFGANCFPNGQDGSSADGTNTPASHVTAIKYLTANTGLGLICRLYEDGSNASAQVTFASSVSTSLPAVKWSACGGFAATLTSTETLADGLLNAGILAFAEGINEPNNAGVHQNNTAFTSAQCLTFQQGMFNKYTGKVPVADASIINTGTNFTTYPQDYLGTNKASEIAACNYWNSHDYPNSGAPSNDLWLWGGGVHQAAGWPAKGVVSEFHPLLFNNTSDEPTGAYYTICARLAGAKYYNHQALIWFSLYDYTTAGFAKPTGLFQNHNPATPRRHAQYIHNLFKLCADTGATRRTFTPGKLDYSISGLPAAWIGQDTTVATGGGQHSLYEDSTGKYYLLIWNEQNALNLTSTSAVTVTFNSGPVASVTDFSITNNATADNAVAIQTKTNTTSITLNLTTEARVLLISGATASSGSGGSQSVRSTLGYSTGKFYYEATATNLTNDFAIGVSTAQYALNAPLELGGDPTGVGFYCVSPAQAIYTGNPDASVSQGTAADANGDVLSCAVDLTNHLIWFTSPVMRTAGQTWNNSTTANPATGTGGIPFTSATPVFDDEFATFAPHRTWQTGDNWGFCATVTPDGRGGPNFDEVGQQWWVNPLNPSTPINNLYVDSNGILQLGVESTPSADASYINTQAGATMPYVSCLLNNQNVAFRKFGYFEYKVAVPKIPGFCFQVDLEDYPATPTWNLEIDMSIGTNGSGVQSMLLQFQWASPSFTSTVVYTNTTLDFTQSHTYGLNWQSDFITLYIDGAQVYQTATNTYGGGIFTTSSMFCYMLTAANYQQANVNPSAASLPAYASVDYFRIYATKPAGTNTYFVTFNDDIGNASCSVNFGASSFVQTIPTGFSAWSTGGQQTQANPPTFADNFSALSLYNIYNQTAGGVWQPSRWYSPDDAGFVVDDCWILNPFNTATPVTGIYTASGGFAKLGLASTPSNLVSAAGGKSYIGAQLQHFRSFKQLHGYFEIRCAVPKLQGTGCSLVLMNDIGWPPELDLMEFPSIGSNPTTQFGKISVWTGNVPGGAIVSSWYTDPNQDPNQTLPGFTGDLTQMHQYGVDWTASTLTFFIDRNQVFQCATPSDYTTAMGFIIDITTGGSWVGALTNPTLLPIFFQLDYVQIWQNRPF